MKIGIDVTPLQIRGGLFGVGSYLRSLILALSRRDPGHEYVLFAYRSVALGLGPLPERFRVVELPVPRCGRARALISHQLALPAIARRTGIGVLHVPSISVSPSMPAAPLWQPVPVVVTVHDLIPLRFPDVILPRLWHRVFYRAMLRAAARAAHIVCESQATGRDVIEYLGIPVTRLTVVPLAADPSFTPSPEPPDDRRAEALSSRGYVLHIGGPLPLKNLARVLAAMVGLWNERIVTADIACVTPRPFDPAGLCSLAGPHRARIHVLEQVPGPFLRWLYRHAICLVFPSLYEGFGLPVLEAMASGCPVITAPVASLPEVGGDAAIYVDPSSPESIGAALVDLITRADRRAAARAAGFRQAARFSYDATADATLAVYEQVARAALVRRLCARDGPGAAA